MNIAQLSEQLKDVPQGTLVGYAKNPNSVVPQFLALAEIQRRQHLQAQAPAPTGTVADDVLAQANPVPQQMAPQQVDSRMLQAQAMQQQAQQLPENQPGVTQLPSGMAQGMASGGIVAFAGGGMSMLDDEEDDREMAQLFPQQSSSRFDQLLEALPSSVAGGIRGLADKGTQAYQAVKSAVPASYEQAKRSVGSAVDTGKEHVEGFLSKLEHLESRGQHFDKQGRILTSPKGAEGIMQVMPKTQINPGYGVTPARDKSPEELKRVGREYGIAMLNEFGDPKLAAMAYNWGPGNVKKWLASDRQLPIPKETAKYASHFADGGRVKSYAGNGEDESLVKDNEYLNRSRNIVEGLKSLGSNLSDAFTNPRNYDPITKFVLDPIEGVRKWGQTPIEEQAQKFRSYSMNPNKDAEIGYRTPAGSNSPVPYGESPPTTLDEVNRLANIAAVNHAQKKEGLDYKKANIPEPGPTDQDFKDFDQASALFEAENKIKDLQAPKAPAAPSQTDLYAEALNKSLQKQMAEAEQNKKMQLGLSLLGAAATGLQSGSRYLGQGLGASLSGGVSTYGALKKQEQDQAKDILATQLGMYKYGSAAENAAANRASEEKYKDLVLAQKGQISQAELVERIRAHDLTAKAQAGQRLIDIERILTNKFEKDYNLTPEQKQAAIFGHPLYRKAAAEAGLDLTSLGGPIQIKDKSEYDKLQRGQQYLDPQGQLRTKG